MQNNRCSTWLNSYAKCLSSIIPSQLPQLNVRLLWIVSTAHCPGALYMKTGTRKVGVGGWEGERREEWKRSLIYNNILLMLLTKLCMSPLTKSTVIQSSSHKKWLHTLPQITQVILKNQLPGHQKNYINNMKQVLSMKEFRKCYLVSLIHSWIS